MSEKHEPTESPTARKNRKPGTAPVFPLSRDAAFREAVEVASLMGPAFSTACLVHLGISPETLDRCFEAGVFTQRGPGKAGFTRPGLQRKTADELPWSKRRKLHLRLAKVFEATRGGTADIAGHYESAHAYTRARRAWLRAAEAASARKDYSEALEAFRNALAIWPAGTENADRRQVLFEAARCAENDGHHSAAEEMRTELFREAVGRNDYEAAIDACQRLADLARRRCEPPAVRRHLDTAAALADRWGECRTIAKTRFDLAAFLTDRIRLHAALKEIETAEHAAVRCDDRGLESEISGFRGLILAMLGRPSEARKAVDASLRLALDHNRIEAVATAYRRLANLRDYAADYPGERDSQLKAIAFCREKNIPEGVHTCLSCLSYAFFRTGQWKRALETAGEVLRTNEAHPALQATALLVRGLIATFRGERRKAEALLDDALLRLRRESVVGLEFFALWAQAVLAEADGRTEDAGHSYSEVRMLWADTEDVHDAVPALFSAATFYADRERIEDLRDYMDVLNRIASRNDTAETRAARQAVLGEAARAEGDLSRACEALRQAVSEYDNLGSPVERALVCHRLSLALAAGGNEEEASRWRREAAATAERLGMRLILAKIEKERPATATEPENTAGLTVRQREVVRLMSQGLTNKEIAARLSLSPRTVDMHVARTLQRLFCRTRAQATRKASDLGIV